MAIKELWAPIPDADGYEVSNLGRVRSLSRTVVRGDGTTQTFRGRVLKQHSNRNGYFHVDCYRTRQVHQMVARAFIPNPNKKPQVNHKDGDKSNNRVSNLEWVSHKENAQHASRTGLASGGSMPGSSHPCSKLAEEQVREILSSPKSGADLAREFGVSQVLISLIRRRKNWKHVNQTDQLGGT